MAGKEGLVEGIYSVTYYKEAGMSNVGLSVWSTGHIELGLGFEPSCSGQAVHRLAL